ncbi:hypothetical protein ISTM_381 [Insectomime virus]|uniref:Uncharacterized protein n=1 Tax=Tunisvirus fontaine2 TaxID=1421067 RepID=V9SFN6_9VIRU|nr:hypothetical protein D1R32_gp419 [Tunisvirus fontaine2]AHA46279.1 hypothetical protein ISTM_381 [Insectomime virus]AHC55136.1 hypothetical protein TNS_ORF418 [Tunisvirus fontaine2]
MSLVLDKISSLFYFYGVDSFQYTEILSENQRQYVYVAPGPICGFWTEKDCEDKTYYGHPKCPQNERLSIDALLYFIESDIKHETKKLRRAGKNLKKRLRKAKREKRQLLEECADAKQEVVLLLEQNRLLRETLNLSGVNV